MDRWTPSFSFAKLVDTCLNLFKLVFISSSSFLDCSSCSEPRIEVALVLVFKTTRLETLTVRHLFLQLIKYDPPS